MSCTIYQSLLHAYFKCICLIYILCITDCVLNTGVPCPLLQIIPEEEEMAHLLYLTYMTFQAPEMVCSMKYDASVDLWSVGVILYGELAPV